MTTATQSAAAALKGKTNARGSVHTVTPVQTKKTAANKLKKADAKGAKKTGTRSKIDYARVTHLWNDKGMTTSQICDELGWTKPDNKFPYSKGFSVLQRLREGVEVDGKTYKIASRHDATPATKKAPTKQPTKK